MASPLDDEKLLEKLKEPVDPQAQAKYDAEINRRVHAQYERAEARLSELVGYNQSLPVTISSVTILNAPNTRRSFLGRIFNPLLSIHDNQFYTLSEALGAINNKASQLERLDVFHQPISIFIDRPPQTHPSSTPTDVDVFLSVREKSRLVASSGTWAGANDGSVYLNVLLRNIFGGAESLNINASRGTRTRSSYSANFDAPILSNPDLRFELGGLQSATDKSWASHEERLKGGFARFKWLAQGGHRHELTYHGMWRQVSSLGEKASPTIRGDAGDSFKSSIAHTWINDRRNNPLLPTSGYLMKAITEIAGYGPLKGDVAFGKFELEGQSNLPLLRSAGISLTTSLRGGVLYPLAMAGDSAPQQSRINDRFTLGGPTDVRGFRFAGLGPRDGLDAVGGDVYAAGGASLLFPFPRVGNDHPLRFHAFINGGRLLALKDSRPTSADGAATAPMSSNEVGRSVNETIQQLGEGLPSMTAGIGVIYALPVARFELNFSLPLVIRKGEEARKGLSLGVGLTFF